MDLKANGQIITNLHITGRVNVYASNVTIRRSKITCNSASAAIRTFPPAVNLIVEDVEIDGKGLGGATVCGTNYTLRRLNIHDVIDGPRLESNTNVVDSWIHDLVRVVGSHNDALQVTGGTNITVRHNRLDAYRTSTGDPMNACLMLGSTTAPTVNNLLFEDNYCNGGNYTIGVRTDLVASNLVVRGNAFGRNFRYGVIARPRHPGLAWDASSNIWHDTRLAVAT